MDFNELSQKINEFFKDLPENLKKVPDKAKKLPNDEKIAWSCIGVGMLIILIAIIVW